MANWKDLGSFLIERAFVLNQMRHSIQSERVVSPEGLAAYLVPGRNGMGLANQK